MGMRMWGAVLAVPVVFGVAACGDDGGGSGVASAGGAAKVSVSASPTGSLSAEDAQLKFAQCMRENGVNVPDPGSGGARARRLGEGTDRAKLQAALEKCKQWLQAGGSLPDLTDPKVRDQYVKFAQCMREHGVNIPDPGSDGQLTIPKERVDQGKTEKAREACRGDLPGFGR
ncbi:hypothetical protein [Actinomadura formosensis]|uniref:hypothetical protein n=1 Tax=Actinomadura formosensis TaxID=60706 RepID=UPI0010415762|nr:hypothetical protein [Actinomadura formosensis]